MSFNQGEFSFDSQNGENGYDNWQAELDQYKRNLESKWGIILSKKIRVYLRQEDKPIEGIMDIAESPSTSSRAPQLSIGHRTFPPSEIESITRLNSD